MAKQDKTWEQCIRKSMEGTGVVASSVEEWTSFIQAGEPTLSTVYPGQVLATEERQEDQWGS